MTIENKMKPIHQLNRRNFIKSCAVVGTLIPVPFFTKSSASSYRNEPRGSTVTFGIIAPKSGGYVNEGSEQIKGFRLAVEHINGDGDGGMLNTFSSSKLRGNGVNGKRVQFVIYDSTSRSDKARYAVKRAIEKHGAIMITGGVATSETYSIHNICRDSGIIFMAGRTYYRRFSSSYTFRHFINAEMSSAAISSLFERGSSRNAIHVSGDWVGGNFMERSNLGRFDALGWSNKGQFTFSTTSPEFSSMRLDFMDSGIDTVVLNMSGNNLVKAVYHIQQTGFLSKSSSSNEPKIIAPLLTNSVAKALDGNLSGVIGTVNWDNALEDNGSRAFTKSYGAKYGEYPTQDAHSIYCQTLLYADAAQRAGTFHPRDVSRAMEGFRFTGLGTGTSHIQGWNHQCVKDTIVVEGKSNPSLDSGLFKIAKIVPGLCIFCGTSGPETCSTSACSQDQVCCNGTCAKSCP